MNSLYCATCGISCPSDYQYQEHINGRKHRKMLSGGGKKIRGVCFQFQNTGRCSKGSYCTYEHVKSFASQNAFCQEISKNTSSMSTMAGNKRTSDTLKEKSSNEIVSEYLLCKNVNANPVVETEPASSTSKGDAFSLMMSFSKKMNSSKNKKKSDNPYNYPSYCKNALKRKQNVNLYIKDGIVIWQFSYNRVVIDAVKIIKGRKWDTNIGLKGSWVCPLESLPECVALYEWMGRTPDNELKERAKKIAKSYNGGSASDAIKIAVKFSVDGLSSDNDHLSFGSADFTFFYDADVVKSLKMVPPSARSYDPVTKAWTIELLALSHALEFLSEIGYSPTKGLKTLSDALAAVDGIVHGGEGSAETTPDPEPSSDTKQEIDLDAQLAKAAEKAEKENERNNQLKQKVKEIISLLRNSENKPSKSIDRSDVGQAKVRRLTLSQIEYSLRGNYYDDGDDKFDFMDIFSTFNNSSIYSSSRSKQRPSSSVAKDCDCGRPWQMIGGRHTCRYFGKFNCHSCGNTWTSAYCWKGEAQSCRKCNQESLPVTTEKLKKSDPTLCRKTNGAHDSSRCAMCKKLGYNCSSRY